LNPPPGERTPAWDNLRAAGLAAELAEQRSYSAFGAFQRLLWLLSLSLCVQSDPNF
jgi:hypothetical protein